MHPNPAFRETDAPEPAALPGGAAFVAVFVTTPEGPRVAHSPAVQVGPDRLRFHLARGNALARQLDGATALAVWLGPDSYVSPRWYSDSGQVPTWNYAALEFEGPVARLPDADLPDLLALLSARMEAALPTPAWTMDKVPEATMQRLLGAIIGFELTVTQRRATHKLSQNKPAAERQRLAAGLDAQGAPAMARLMRDQLAAEAAA